MHARVVTRWALSLVLAVCFAGCGADEDQETTKKDKSGKDGQQKDASPKDDNAPVSPISAARRKAQEMQRRNNLKQVLLAMHSYHDTFRNFPAQASVDQAGKPLLSWRVQILPFLEYSQLYDQFKMDEPWDSPHNIKLLEQMPDVYKSTDDPTKTTVLGFAGEGAFFDGAKATGIFAISDGSSNTIAVVDAGADKAIPWTKPEDLTFVPMDPASQLGDVGDSFIIGLCDGAVRSVRKNLPADQLKSLITIKGGEVIGDY